MILWKGSEFHQQIGVKRFVFSSAKKLGIEDFSPVKMGADPTLSKWPGRLHTESVVVGQVGKSATK